MRLKSGYVRGGVGVVKVSRFRYEVRPADEKGYCDMSGEPIATARDWGAACAIVDKHAGPKAPQETDDELAARVSATLARMTPPAPKSDAMPPVRAMRAEGDPF